MEYNYQEVLLPGVGVNPDIIKRLPDNLYIPNDDQNTDWQQYQVWLAAGNVPLPPA